MARRNQSDDDLLMDEDELTAAFLGDDDSAAPQSQVVAPGQPAPAVNDEWDESEDLPGQLAVDVYETREKLVVKARTAGVNKNDLDVSISDNTLSIRGTLSAGNEVSRSIALPVPVKEEEIEEVLKDGVLTISFAKVKQDTIKKIQVQ